MEGQEGNLDLAHKLFLLTNPDVDGIGKVHLCNEVLAAVKTNDMASLYELLHVRSVLEMAKGVLDSMWKQIEEVLKELYKNPLSVYYMREVRMVVFSQFLESCKSVAMEAMATEFGATVDFIDLELSCFIAAGKLRCKIAGVL